MSVGRPQRRAGDSAAGYGGYTPPQPVRRRRSIVAQIACHLSAGWHQLPGFSGHGGASRQSRESHHRPTDAVGREQRRRVLIGGQWWRIVTAMFVHVGILHLATNMWCLWNLGLLAEPLMGSVGVVAVYILTGAAGNLLSTLVTGSAISRSGGVFPAGAGASGAVFGIAGALIVLLKSPRLPVPPWNCASCASRSFTLRRSTWCMGFSISFGKR